MKIKHFAGYGTVDAKKIGKTTYNGITILSVLVTGKHEQGLTPYYIDKCGDMTLKTWLVDRFDRAVKDVYPLRFKTDVDEMSIDGSAVRYTFTYRIDGGYLFEY